MIRVRCIAEAGSAGAGFRCHLRNTHRTVLLTALLGLLFLVVGACSGGGFAHIGAVAPVAVAIAPSGAAAAAMNPTTPVRVTAHGGRLSSVVVTNTASGVRVTGGYSLDRAAWTSNEPLGYGAHYRVVATGENGAGRRIQRQATITTLDPARQAYANLIPAPNVVAASGVGIAQPIVFQFTHPVKNKAAVQARLQVSSTPSQPGAWYWTDDENVHYRPETFWTPGTVIHVAAHLYGMDLGDGTYAASDNAATYHVHDSWIAKANGDTEQMTILHNGVPVKTMPISMGKGSTPTHTGIHVISNKQKTVDMNSCSFGVCSGPQAYNVIEYWAERISNDGEFVHENPESVADQGNSNVSHGCINLDLANAEWFFHHLGYGDPVIVTGSNGPLLPVWDLYGDWSVPWPQWKAGDATTS